MRLARPTAAMTGILALAVMAGCDDGRDYPSLLPTDQVLAQPALPAHAGGVGTDPAAVTDTLMARRAAERPQAGPFPRLRPRLPSIAEDVLAQRMETPIARHLDQTINDELRLDFTGAGWRRHPEAHAQLATLRARGRPHAPPRAIC